MKKQTNQVKTSHVDVVYALGKSRFVGHGKKCIDKAPDKAENCHSGKAVSKENRAYNLKNAENYAVRKAVCCYRVVNTKNKEG